MAGRRGTSKQRTIVLSILSSHPLDRKEDGRAIIGSLHEHLGIWPALYGNWEPLNRRFDSSRSDVALYCWKFPSFLWSNGERGVGGSVGIGARSHITLRAVPGEFHQDELESLLVDWSRIADADFAYLHRLTDAEVSRGLASRTVNLVDRIARSYILFVTVHDLRRYIPDLYWATVFGRPYVGMFGRERLESLPGVERVHADQFLVRLTPRLDDLVDEPRRIEERREQIRRHLGEDAFFDPFLGREHDYRTPDLGESPATSSRGAVWD